jgi:hypothetical protein
MRFKITILFLFLGLFASAQFHSPYYHASVVDSLILKHRGDTLFHIRLSHNRDTLFINNSYFVGGGGSSLDTTWTDNGFASKKQTSKRDTVQSEVFYTPFDGGGSMYKIGNYGYLQQSYDKTITLANDNLTSSLFLGEKEISLLTNGLSQQGYVQIDSSHVILYTQGKAAELDSNSFFPNINESLYNINLGKNLYPWDSIFSKHLQLQNLSGSGSVLGIDINGNVIKTSVGGGGSSLDTTWTDNGFASKKQTSKRDTVSINNIISNQQDGVNRGVIVSDDMMEGLMLGYKGGGFGVVNPLSILSYVEPDSYGVHSMAYDYLDTTYQRKGKLDIWGNNGSSISQAGKDYHNYSKITVDTNNIIIDSKAIVLPKLKVRTGLDTIMVMNNDSLYKQLLPVFDTSGSTYTAGYGLGLSGTTFYNSRYWGTQDSLKTSLSGLVLATAGKLTAITNNSSNWDNGYAYRLIGATGSSPLTLGLSGNALTGSIDTTTAKTGVANLYQLSLKQNKLATSADTSKFAWHDLTMHKLYYSNIQGTPFTWNSENSWWTSTYPFVLSNSLSVGNGLTVHGTQVWDNTYAASSFDSIIGLTSGTVGRMKWYLPFYAKDTNTQGNPITLKYGYTHYQPIGSLDTTTGVGLKLETKYHSTVTYTAKSKIIMLFPSQFVDTSALISAGKVLLGYSVNITIDTLIIILNRRAGTPSITPNVYFGTDWTAAGTSIITSPSAVTSYTTVTKIYGAALQNTAISAGNQIWGKWTLTVAPKELYFILLGHYN